MILCVVVVGGGGFDCWMNLVCGSVCVLLSFSSRTLTVV